MVRMPGFGLAGPWRDYVGWALNIEQLSGMSACTGYADGPPCNLQGPADPVAGVHAAVALLAALEHKRRTGEGQLIEVAQIEVGAAVTAEPVIEYSLTGKVRPREGNRHRTYAQGVYPASGHDEWVAISVRHDSDWAAVVEAIGLTDLRDDARFASQAARLEDHDAFDEVLAAWTGKHGPDEVVEELVRRGVPAESGAHCRSDVRRRPARRARLTTRSWCIQSPADIDFPAGHFALRRGRYVTTARRRRRSDSTMPRCCNRWGSPRKRSPRCVSSESSASGS